MKKQIVQKLKSQSGASILLALLFFMICMLVTSAILMAAVSNAGKKHSNEEEHQKYLAVSSALQLVMDELKNSSYCGQYEYSETKDANDNIVKTYTQQKGSYKIKKGETPSAEEKDSRFAPLLLPELDYIFRETMKRNVADWTKNALEHSIEKTYVLPDLVDSNIIRIPPEKGHTLEVKVPDPEAASLPNDLNMTVEITLQLIAKGDDCYSFELAAWQGDYLMKAELTAAVTAPKLSDTATPGVNKSEPMTWRIGWITKERKEIDGETP